MSEREREGWKIDWPVSEEGYEEMKEICARRGISVRAAGELVGQISPKKPKKDDGCTWPVFIFFALAAYGAWKLFVALFG